MSTAEQTPRRPATRRRPQPSSQLEWDADPRWDGIQRDYTADDVVALRGSVREERTLARRGAEKLWELIHEPAPPTIRSGSRRSARSPATRPCSRCAPVSRPSTSRGWQVAADAQPRRPDLPRPEPVPGELGARGRAAHQQRAAARRPDRARRGRADRTTGSRRSSRMPRPASADRSTPTSSCSR